MLVGTPLVREVAAHHGGQPSPLVRDGLMAAMLQLSRDFAQFGRCGSLLYLCEAEQDVYWTSHRWPVPSATPSTRRWR